MFAAFGGGVFHSGEMRRVLRSGFWSGFAGQGFGVAALGVGFLLFLLVVVLLCSGCGGLRESDGWLRIGAVCCRW